MKTLRMGMLCAVASAGIRVCFAAGETSWSGNAEGAVDWNESGNWSAGVPTGDTTAILTRADNRLYYRMTPSADFTGRIVTTNVTTSLTVTQPTYVELGGAEAGTWCVSGNGTVILTNGIVSRIADDFVGTIDVPVGKTLVVPASLPSAVTFTGAGTLQLDSAVRLPNAAGFAGVVVCPAGSTLAPDDVVTLRSGTVRLGDGSTLAYAANALAWGQVRELDGWTVPGAWSFNRDCTQIDALEKGGSVWTFDRSYPTVAADGTLILKNDVPQIRTVFLTNRLVRVTDDWGVRFTAWQGVPETSKYHVDGVTRGQNGWFGFFLQDQSPTLVGTSYANPVPNGYGFKQYCYRDSGKNDGLTWSFDATASYDSRNSLKESFTGIQIGKPIDYTVTCVDGLLTVVLEQDGKSVSMRRSVKDYLAAHPQGVYLGFGAGGGWWSDTSISMLDATVSDFRGWIRSKAEGNWQPVADNDKFYPLSADNYFLQSTNTAGAFQTGNDALNPDGSFDFLPHRTADANRNATAGSLVPLSAQKRYVISVDYDWSAVEGSNADEGYAIALCKWRPGASWQFCQFNDVLDGWCLWAGMRHCVYYAAASQPDYLQVGIDTYDKSNAHQRDVSDKLYGAFPRTASTSVHLDYLYDPSGDLTFELTRTAASDVRSGFRTSLRKVCNSTVAQAFVARGAKGGSTSDDNMYLTFHGYCKTWGSLPTTVKGIAVREMGDNPDARLGAVEVTDGATATISVPSFGLSGTTPVARFAALTLGESGALTVAPADGAACVDFSSVTLGTGSVLTAAEGATLSCTNFVLSSGAAGLTLAGSVDLGSAIELTIPQATHRAAHGRTLVDWSGADFRDGLPSSVRILDETGLDRTGRYSVRITAAGVSVDHVGLVMIVR